MITSIMQGICAGLFTIGLLVLVAEMRARLDRSLLYASITLMLLCAFAGIDLLSGWKSILWMNVQQIIFCFIPPVLLSYLCFFAGRQPGIWIRFFFLISAIISLPFFFGLGIEATQPRFVLSTFYKIVYTPFAVISLLCIFVFIFANVNNDNPIVRRDMRLHLAGIVLLMIAGVMDLLQAFHGIKFIDQVNSYSICGILFFGLIILHVFTSRILSIARERRAYIEKLKAAYLDLEQARHFSELGQSVAKISHEIKNYAFSICANAFAFRREPHNVEQASGIINGIDDSGRRIAALTKDILLYSRARIATAKEPLRIDQIIKGCLNSVFAEHREKFMLGCVSSDLIVACDEAKLHQVFVNLFLNAVEAGAQHVQIRIRDVFSTILVSVEDDGTGCGEKQFASFFTPFHSTKKNGCGLGLVTSRAILDSHGATLTAIPKNIIPGNGTGMVFCLTFPSLSEKPEPRPTVQLTGCPNPTIEHALRIFRNLGLQADFTVQTESSNTPDSEVSAFICGNTSPAYAHLTPYPAGIWGLQKAPGITSRIPLHEESVASLLA